jgi:hypothetical protein
MCDGRRAVSPSPFAEGIVWVALIIVDVALELINRFIPMASSIKTILNVVVVMAL